MNFYIIVPDVPVPARYHQTLTELPAANKNVFKNRTMPKMTPVYAKNTIRRTLRAIVDPDPREREISDLWEYYKSMCAYCERPLNRANREGHLDHLVPTNVGGGNQIGNRALSCPPCNGDEKREMDWVEFLHLKSDNDSIFTARYTRIETWIRTRSVNKSQVDSTILEREMKIALEAFDRAVATLRLESNRLKNIR